MVDTPYSAMSRFVQSREARPKMWSTDPNLTSDDALDEACGLLRPFLLNPERHERHVRAILTGLALDMNFIVIRPITRFLDSWIGRALLSAAPHGLKRSRLRRGVVPTSGYPGSPAAENSRVFPPIGVSGEPNAVAAAALPRRLCR